MRTTPLGGTGLSTPVQGLGCMRMGDVDQATSVINRALDLGVSFLDTADMYGSGQNEELVGRALRGRRDEAVLGTKFGVIWGAGGSYTLRGDPEYVHTACDASLKRLGVDVIDLYYLHHVDPEVPIGETVGAMAELVAAGKVRHLGLSSVTGAELRAAHAVHPIAALQSRWSLCARDIEQMVPVCAELGVGVVPFGPNGSGLFGRGEAARAELATIDPAYAALPDLLAAIAERRGVTPSQIALAWVQQRAEFWNVAVAPIPGTVRVAHLEENAAALDITLSADELAQLDIRTS